MQRRLPLVEADPWLAPYEKRMQERQDRLRQVERAVERDWGSLARYARLHDELGMHRDPAAGAWRYREWAPRAERLALIGDFNGWDRAAHPLRRGEHGIWELVLPDGPAGPVLGHESRFKVHVVGKNGARDRIPALARRTVQDPQTHDFAAQIWDPPRAFRWSEETFDLRAVRDLVIYEAHVGMAQERQGVGTYLEFAEEVLPRVARGGYTALQLMAIQEHPYYGSFGYHVSSFFAPSSRFGTPDELRALIDAAHGMGLAVLLDVVHSHAIKNWAEGLVEFDGEEGLYFHGGGRGYHRGWDSYLFDYGREEVRRFLLSNLVYWLEEFRFDGFRFDGVTSILYHHHGDMVVFDSYERYFDGGVDEDAVLYLQLAAEVSHQARPGAILVAEDMSGMPGLCRPLPEGGLGFDYRLGMGIPDYWIRLLKHSRDEDWNLHEMWHVLTNRREGEKTVAYAESHDQALVGDKTIAFWLMDKEMYTGMHEGSGNLVVERGLALHKLIRLVTLALGGEAYLTFMGNEFGHPEWVDFPRAGNGWSYWHARRQWSLADDPHLRFRRLLAFDGAMVRLARRHRVLDSGPARQLWVDTENQVLAFSRGGLVFAFNFHVERSLPGYRLPVPRAGEWVVELDSDASEFGGAGRVDGAMLYPAAGRQEGGELSVYLPNRSALVWRLVDGGGEDSSCGPAGVGAAPG